MTRAALCCLPLALGIALAAHAQPGPIQVSLKAGAKSYDAAGTGECKAAPQASIYGIQAALYSVSHRSGGQSLNLTLWQPKDGSPSMMSLRVSIGSSHYEVDTVKGGAKRDTRGSGRATLQRASAGGVIAIDAVAASGEKIAGKIQCSRFGAIHAEGG